MIGYGDPRHQFAPIPQSTPAEQDAAAARQQLATILADRSNERSRRPPGDVRGPRPIDMGYGDEALGVAGLALGPAGLATGAFNTGVRLNNLGFRQNVQQALGMPGYDIGQKMGAVFGLNEYGEGHGMIGRAKIGNRGYGVSIGGGVYDGQTTLTADEAMKRASIARGQATQGTKAAGPKRSGGNQDPKDNTGRARGRDAGRPGGAGAGAGSKGSKGGT
jgi:hypothetical protein